MGNLNPRKDPLMELLAPRAACASRMNKLCDFAAAFFCRAVLLTVRVLPSALPTAAPSQKVMVGPMRTVCEVSPAFDARIADAAIRSMNAST